MKYIITAVLLLTINIAHAHNQKTWVQGKGSQRVVSVYNNVPRYVTPYSSSIKYTYPTRINKNGK